VRRRSRRSAAGLAAALLAAGPGAPAAGETLSLTFLESRPIPDREAGFTEPSGLARAPDGTLWAVSDDTAALFRLSPEGRAEAAFPSPRAGLEGVAVTPDGARLFAVREKNDEVLVFDLPGGALATRRRLSEMAGWEAVAAAFEGSPPNKGLEGVSVDPATGAVWVLKEGEPRMLLALSPDLSRIEAHRVLRRESGFAVEGMDDETLDVSGLAQDAERGLFWIVSDRGRRLFAYDWTLDRATSAPLLATVEGERVELRHAEGVAWDAAGRRLSIVNDDGGRSRLFVYELR
jgi:YD repeat-containing protein